jgi:uncharacterized damage-inducible protein DinB
MDPEVATYSKYLREKIAQIHAALGDLTEDELNSAPKVPGANSGFVIATHTCGNVRAWVLGIVCGENVRRDRPAEFVSRGTYAELGTAARKLLAEVDDALRKLDASTLGDRFVPTQELWGEGVPTEYERRDCLAHVLEHAAIHLGHIHMTVQLLKARR